MTESILHEACSSILIGRAATIDGSIIIGRNEDAKAAWPKHMTVHPHEEFTEEQPYTSHDNGFKTLLPRIKAKYTATPEWTDQFGLFEEDGINEYGVAMSGTESTYSNERVLAVDPLVKDGLGEESMITVVLPYIKSAREGVQRLGSLIEQFGTNESNGILFADREAAWYFETGAGHEWVAQRIPDDSYAVVSNQMAIQEVDFDDPDNFMFAQNLRDFVADHQLNPARFGFNFRDIFGTHAQSDHVYNTPRVWYGQKMFNPSVDQQPDQDDMPFLRQAERLLSVDDAKHFLSSHYQETQYDPIGTGSQADKTKFRPISLAKTQESHVLQMRPGLTPEVAGIHWLAMGVAAQSVYVPFFAGITKTPDAYHIGGETYDRDSAYWTYKHVGILVDPHYTAFNELLKTTQAELNIAFAQSIHTIDAETTDLTGEALIKRLNTHAEEMAALGLKRYRELAATLITKSTDLSPLNYHQDLNL